MASTGKRRDHDEPRDVEFLRQATRAFRVGAFEHVLAAEPDAEEHTWSDTMREIIGHAEGEPVDLDWFLGRVHPDDRERVRADIDRAHDPSGDGRFDHEYRWLHPNGEIRRLLVRGETVFGEREGRRVALRSVGAMLDVTERRAAQAEQKRLVDILEATPDFVAITDMTGRFVYLNQAARAFLGIGPDEDVTEHNMTPVHPESMVDTMLNVAIPTAIRDGTWRGENLFIRHDEEEIPFSQVLLGPRDEDGKVTHLSTIARDLSRERELEAQFRHAQKMEAVGRLAGGVAHDFNNLLVAIMGCTEMALDLLEPDHPAREELAEVERASGRAADLTSQLLAFGRKQLLQPRVLDVNEVLRETETLARRLLDDPVRFRVVASGEPSYVKIDPTQLQQVLLNLVVNARDAMPAGGRLTIEARSGEPKGEETDLPPGRSTGPHCLLEVTDTGEGMSPETLAQIFEPFFTTKEAGRGTGLGLSTVKSIVEESGGSITVTSEPGRGSTFRVSLPCAEPNLRDPAAPPPVEKSVVGGHVLVVEDDGLLRSTVARVMQRGGHEVVAAANAGEALELFAEAPEPFDLLLTDVMMPGMNGPELAEKLRAEKPDLAVLFMSGYTEAGVIHPGTLGADVGFIPKPFTPGMLLIAAAEVLSRRAPEGGGP